MYDYHDKTGWYEYIYRYLKLFFLFFNVRFVFDIIDSDIAFAKAAFELRAKSVLWFFVHGTRTIIAFWYTRRAAFYLPKSWFGPAEWFLWMPMAPKGKKKKIRILRVLLKR